MCCTGVSSSFRGQLESGTSVESLRKTWMGMLDIADLSSSHESVQCVSSMIVEKRKPCDKSHKQRDTVFHELLHYELSLHSLIPI
jgi:hypothetical protein